jgi:hypothetical protein
MTGPRLGPGQTYVENPRTFVEPLGRTGAVRTLATVRESAWVRQLDRVHEVDPLP